MSKHPLDRTPPGLTPISDRTFDLFHRLMAIGLAKPVYWSDGSYTFTSDGTPSGAVMVKVTPSKGQPNYSYYREADPRMPQVIEVIEYWRTTQD